MYLSLYWSHFHVAFCIPKSIDYRDWSTSMQQQST